MDWAEAMRRLLGLVATLLLGLATTARAQIAEAPIDLVDPFIGTAGSGNVYPGATLPFGFIQVGPDTGPGSGAGGYKQDKPIDGFSQQHISGMGGPLFGQISVFPMTGQIVDPANIVSTGKSNEVASPGYYSVTLAPWNVKVELTAARHVALHRHTFPSEARPRILVDVGHVLYGTAANWGSARPIAGEVRVDLAAQEVSGQMTYAGGRGSRSWTVFFVARFDAVFATHGVWTEGGVSDVSAAEGAEIGAWLEFSPRAGRPVTSKVALSYRTLDQARGYLDAEGPGFDFDRVHAQARTEWSRALGKIEVEGGTLDQRRQFYTALYRVHLTPNDWTGEAPPRYADGPYFENIMCLWDTFRTVNPLLTLIQPEVQAGIVNTLIEHHRIDGWTGDAHSVWHYEHVQNGSSADIVIADAYVKGLPGVDWEAAYAAIRKNAFVDADPAINNRPNTGRFRLTDYRAHGYLPTDVASYDDIQAVSRTLEYIYNDFAVLTLARAYGTAEDVADLQGRLLWYRNLWDTETGFMRGRRTDGRWHEPFDPLAVETGRQFYEGHAWTWSWYVPHDAQGLIALTGGDAAFVDKLTQAVEHHYEAYNEPGMLQTFLFHHAGRPDLTQHYARRALAHFSSRADGLPGNDDSGTTSAWLIWTMLGLYPNAGQDFYYIGSPSFTRATVHLSGGQRLVLEAPDASAQNMFVGGARRDGADWSQAWLRHADIANGATFHFDMTSRPSSWGQTSRPPSLSMSPPPGAR